jgi:hypothetical protein
MFLHIRAVVVASIALCLLAAATLAHASATLLLEEPYGHMGFFTGTGHAAVYLSNVCADDPRTLRACAPGETGTVISRYDHVGGYDWLAIPLIPYLYAVERPEDIPLLADARMVAFLRDSYRRKHLEEIVPDDAGGKTPGGNWYQLVGSSYDRTIYGFEIETTPEQDAALIRKLNGAPNRSRFHLLSRNCADFAKDIINVYYPRTLHRSYVADVGITTPKQISKMLVKFSAHHPDLTVSRLVIAQVPGSMPRSKNPKGVVESFLKSTKYIVPSAIASPIFAGCVFAVYVGSGGGGFQPDRDAMVFNAGDDPGPPLARADRKLYRRQLRQLLAEANPSAAPSNIDKTWEHLQSRSRTALDEQDAPVLEVRLGEREVSVGISAGNLLNGSAPPSLIGEILAARLDSELRQAPRNGISREEVTRDWNLLKQAIAETSVAQVVFHPTPQQTSHEISPATANSTQSMGLSAEAIRFRP